MREAKRSIGYNYIMNTFIQGSAYILPVIVNPYVSGILGPEGMGKVSFVTAIISYFTLIAVLGVPTYGVREVSKVKSDTEELSQVVYEILFINIVMGVLTYIFFSLYIFLSPQDISYKILLLAMSPSIALNTIGVDWMYKGLEQFSVMAARNVIVKIAVIIMIFIFINTPEDIYIYGILTACASYGYNIWNFIAKKKYIVRKSKGELDVKRHIVPIFIFFSMIVATTIYTNLDMVMLGAMKNDYEAGIYDASAKLKTLMVVAATSLGAVLLPRVTALVSAGKMEGFKRISERALNLIFIFAVAMVAYVEVSADVLINVFSGEAFHSAVPVLRILAPTVILIGMTNIMGIQMLIPLGREKMVLVSEVGGAVTDLVINIVLIPRYGAIGAAIGTLVAEIVVLVIQLCACLDYISSILRCVQYYKILLSGVMAGSVTFFINNYFTIAIWKLCCSIVAFCAIFGGLLFIMRERNIIYIVEKIREREKV